MSAMNTKTIALVFIAFIVGVGVGIAAYPMIFPQKPKTHLLFSLDWAIYGRHTPYFVALEKGFFDDEGLTVEIVRGYGSSDVVQKVATGVVDVGFGDMSALIIALSKDETFDAQMVAMIYARAPFCVFSLASSGIDEPKDLEGKNITAFGPGDINYVLFPYFANVTGFDANSVSWTFASAQIKMQLLVSGDVDAITEFLMAKPVVEAAAESAGAGAVNTIWWAEYGVNLYSNGLIFKKSFIQEHPDVVRGFVKAVVKGFLYTFEHPDEAVEILTNRFPELDEDVARAEIDILEDLVVPPEAEEYGIGYFNESKVVETINAITDVYNLNRTVSPDEVYTSEYLPGKITLESHQNPVTSTQLFALPINYYKKFLMKSICLN